MFWNRDDREKKKLARTKQKETYDRVYKLHQEAKFLCYINEVYAEEYEGKMYVKLVGTMASGEGTVSEQYELYSCEGRLKAKIDIDEFYAGADVTDKLEGADKEVAIYPKQQEVRYKAGDILCKLKENWNEGNM